MCAAVNGQSWIDQVETHKQRLDDPELRAICDTFMDGRIRMMSYGTDLRTLGEDLKADGWYLVTTRIALGRMLRLPWCPPEP
jgi:hypothetical protein